jgi:hypothetical protein
MVLDRRITASADDVEEASNGAVTLDNQINQLNDRATLGLRFAAIDIPRTATIVSAQIELIGRSAALGVTGVYAVAEAADDAAPFQATSNNVTGRVFTTATAGPQTWDPWYQASVYATPDLAACVQEVIGRAGWTSGAHLVFKLSTADGGTDAAVTTFEETPSAAPRLLVVFTP